MTKPETVQQNLKEQIVQVLIDSFNRPWEIEIVRDISLPVDTGLSKTMALVKISQKDHYDSVPTPETVFDTVMTIKGTTNEKLPATSDDLRKIAQMISDISLLLDGVHTISDRTLSVEIGDDGYVIYAIQGSSLGVVVSLSDHTPKTKKVKRTLELNEVNFINLSDMFHILTHVDPIDLTLTHNHD